MTIVWRDIEGVTAYQSQCKAEFLAMDIHIHFIHSLEKKETSILGYYAIEGDRIASFSANSLEEVADLVKWVDDSIEKELAKNKQALGIL